MLVRVKVAGVGAWDAWIRAGKSMLPQPRPLTLGSDISGLVEMVGPGVTELVPGDAVFGVTNPRFTGGYADYAIASAAMLAKKPDMLSHVDSASVPVVAVTAWQGAIRTGTAQARPERLDPRGRRQCRGLRRATRAPGRLGVDAVNCGRASIGSFYGATGGTSPAAGVTPDW